MSENDNLDAIKTSVKTLTETSLEISTTLKNIETLLHEIKNKCFGEEETRDVSADKQNALVNEDLLDDR